jgi:hypothetical protein
MISVIIKIDYCTSMKGDIVLNLVLTEKQCKSCQARLTEYEIENNSALCMDCYKEEKDEQK